MPVRLHPLNLSAVTAALLCFIAVKLSAAQNHPALPAFYFTNASESLRWEAAHDVAALRATPEGLQIDITGRDPFVIGPEENVSAEQPVYLRLRLRSESGGFGQVFWFEKHAREEQSVWFQASPGRWTETVLPLPRVSRPVRLRIDPPGTNGACVVGWIRFETANQPGIRRVTATSKTLHVALEGSTDQIDVLELAPEQSYSDMDAAPVALGGLAQGQTNGSIPRFDGQRDRIYSGFLAVRSGTGGKRSSVGLVRFVEDLKSISKSAQPFPTVSSKKGLQVQMADDAIALGVRHAALNLNLTRLIDLNATDESLPWAMDGRIYHFNRRVLDSLAVKQLSDAGMVISLILLAYESGDPARDRLMIHPRYEKAAPNRLGAFNTAHSEGLRHYQACLEFLADRFSGPDPSGGRVANYIIGNEVNSHWHWYNLGRTPPEVVAEEYLRAVRVAHTAVRKSSATARVYLSLEHHWNISFEPDSFRTLSGRRLLEHFAAVARMGGDFDWHLAFHPYPENLFQPRTWQDRTATRRAETPRITFKNLDVLTGYLRQPDLLYRGVPRRVILSEQGFHSDATEAGELAQAAAYCYAYYKADHLEGIDSFILHRHVDHKQEGGLNLGLWRRHPDSVATPAGKKPIYEVFRAADTLDWERAFQFALPLIGITNWNEILPGE